MSYLTVVLFACLIFLSPFSIYAQTEAGIRISSADFDDTREVDDGETILLEFEEDLGYGIFVGHFWTSRFSTELAIDRLGGDLDATFGNEPPVTVGELEVRMYSATALWHFRRVARVSPYAGLGAAYLTGRFDLGNEVEVGDELDLENELTWVARGGVAIRLTGRVSLTGDARYVAYEPAIEDEEGESESVDLNPLLLSAGIRVRF